MMNSMIKENGVIFKELEKNIYAWEESSQKNSWNGMTGC